MQWNDLLYYFVYLVNKEVIIPWLPHHLRAFHYPHRSFVIHSYYFPVVLFLGFIRSEQRRTKAVNSLFKRCARLKPAWICLVRMWTHLCISFCHQLGESLFYSIWYTSLTSSSCNFVLTSVNWKFKNIQETDPRIWPKRLRFYEWS